MRNIHALIVSLTLSWVAQGAEPAPVSLWRLDCGALQEADLNMFSDIDAYVGQSRHLTVSCYLIKHGDTYMLWDTGLPDEDLGLPLEGARSKGETVARLLPDELAAIGVKPEQISIIAVSHYHFDHTGQAHHFPQARLLMGKGDVAVLRSATEPSAKERAKPLEHWLNGAGKLEEVDGDDRFKGLAKNLHATVVIQHESGDIAKLPAFPASAQ